MVAIANLPLLFTAMGPREGSLNPLLPVFQKCPTFYITKYSVMRHSSFILGPGC